MIHETDPALDGCDFGRFFDTTPPDLIADGLYKALATAFVKGEKHRTVSYQLIAKNNLGAVKAWRRRRGHGKGGHGEEESFNFAIGPGRRRREASLESRSGTQASSEASEDDGGGVGIALRAAPSTCEEVKEEGEEDELEAARELSMQTFPDITPPPEVQVESP